jgi:hypothetical protein
MPVKLVVVRSLIPFVCLLSFSVLSPAQPLAASPDAISPAQAQSLVDRALAAELREAQDSNHPMRFLMRKTSPRLATTKEIYETRDGAVARLLSINGQPLSQADEQKELARLDALLHDPSRQRHRKQSGDEDTRRALKVLRALPAAFLYQYVESTHGPSGELEKFFFKPNPRFASQDLETQVLTAMTGCIWIDATHQRVTRLEGRLQQDVNFGWGILGRLNRGGWIAMDQADVGGNQWRIVRFQMSMSGRVLFKNKSFDTTEEQARYAPLPTGIGYVQAIQMLRATPANIAYTGR